MEDINSTLQQLSTSLLELKLHMVAGDALNSFYSALILKKLSGIEITLEVEADVMLNVF